MKFLGKILFPFVWACLFVGQAFASSLPVASFRIDTKTDIVEEGVNLSVTVTALDADGDVAEGYMGTVYFVVKGDKNPTIPANIPTGSGAKGYTFQSAEKGVHTFSEGITFHTVGMVDMYAIDLDNENVQGSKKITIVKNPCQDTSALISLLSPKDGTTVSIPSVDITGGTRAGCAAEILLNDKKYSDIRANEKGSYSASITGLVVGENTITARLSNGNQSQIRVLYQKDQITITSPTDGDVASGSCVLVTGTANPQTLITLALQGKDVATATANAQGQWSAQVCGLVPGINTITARTPGGATATVRVTLSSTITITSPVNGSRISSSCQQIIGTSNPSSEVSVFLNGNFLGKVMSDSVGKWEISACGFISGKNTITAKNIFGSQAQSIVNFEAFLTITSPKTGDRLTQSGVHITGEGTPNMPVVIRVGQSEVCRGVTDTQGKFDIPNCALPSCDVVLSGDGLDAQGKVMAKSNSVSLKVLPTGNTCDQVHFTLFRGARSVDRVSLEFAIAPDPDAVKNFAIFSGDSCENLSNKKETFEKQKIYASNWKNYAWWIPSFSGAMAVQAAALDASGAQVGLRSECLLLQDEQCEIGNISRVQASADVAHLRSRLSWDPHPDAESYNIYRIPEGQSQPQFFQNISGTSLTLSMTKDRVRFEDFIVRGVCKKGAKPEADLKNATKVQTGPELWFLLVPILLILGGIMLRIERQK